MTKELKLFLTACLVVAFCTVGAGQSSNATLSQASMTFLSSPLVRKEIKLTKQQETSIEAEFKKLDSAMRAIFAKRPTNEKEQRAAQEKARQAQLRLLAYLDTRLTAPQKSRLRQIALQQAGPFAMLSPELKKEIGLNPSQTKKIESAQKELVEKVRTLQMQRQKEMQSIPAPKDPKDQKAMDAYRKKAEAMVKKYGPGDAKKLESYKAMAESKVLAALTALQRGKWKSLLGAPFKAAPAKRPAA